MLLGGVSPTPYDLRFRLLGFPVRVHPLFWLVALLLGAGLPPQYAILWVGVVFVSVLVHELGHALLQRAFGGRPQIVLYALGGVAMTESAPRSWWRNVVVALAGPLAGFALAGVSAGLLSQFGGSINLFLGNGLEFLVLVNVLWGVVNLLPVYPLDGGHVARELLTRFLPPVTGVTLSFWLSIVTAVIVGVALSVMMWSVWNLALFGFLAYQNYLALVAYRRSRGV